MRVRWVHPADRQVSRFSDPQTPAAPSGRALAGSVQRVRGNLEIWNPENLPTDASPVRPQRPPGRRRGGSRV